MSLVWRFGECRGYDRAHQAEVSKCVLRGPLSDGVGRGYRGEPSQTARGLFTVRQVAGGPKIPMRYGREDATEPDHCPMEGNLPGLP